MGCTASSTSFRVANAKQRPKTPEVQPSQTIMTVKSSVNSEESLRQSFDLITLDVKKVASPANQMPIVCLTGDAFPILVAPISDSDPLQLPIVAASYSRLGRIVCFSQLTFLTNTILQMEQTMKLVTRSINWLCDGVVEKTPIAIFTKNAETKQIIAKCLLKLNMNPIEEDSDMSNSKVIVLTTDVDTSDHNFFSELVHFLIKGGGIMVFYNHSPDQSFTINNFLIRYGLSYSYQLINVDCDETPILTTCTDFYEIKNHNLINLKDILVDVLDEDEPDLTSLEDVVTDIRHYLFCADERQVSPLVDLLNHAWDYMNKSNYSQNGLICRDMRQCIVAVLILDIYRKIPLQCVMPIPEASIFPGSTKSLELGCFSKQFDIPDASWISTGLYLPPLVVGRIKVAEKCPGLTIQVGSHSESLLTKCGPLKRWPMITFGFSMIDESIEVGSPFGGIIYISSDDESIESIDIEFIGFAEYPVFNVSDPSVWERTKDIEAPFGEIETNSLIITLPTEKMRKLNLPLLCDMFGKMHHSIITFLGSPLLHHDRIVFDIELADDNKRTGYPIVEKIDDIDKLLNNIQSPTIKLFEQFSRIAVDDIRENLFDHNIEHALGTVAAAIAFQKVYPKFDPFNFKGLKTSGLFEIIWKIHFQGKQDWIPQTLIKFQDSSYIISNIPEDTWIQFVKELCITAKYNFIPLLDTFYPIPLNVIESLQDLPIFKLSS
ncbi:hypothetical protein TRFO_18951 [Tritrichomonas foetus]|uniref:Peptidase M60 domain-containing protein n=1 Tax=Tritrichomonas foetus TaxID=1144522 RepID=A0A1J4KKQ2_9EUKA|nr:hypothetical protein TRFO_18951 [Tritrichomonas foetus]|eukprot:OHT11512.1 hypothetical protein TRFO_18951 [Tritrichomonas foetus]